MPGLYFEDLPTGTVVKHELRRTVTEADNVWFCAATMNPQPLHMDAEFAAQSPYGQRLMNSMFTLGLITGMTVTDMTIGTTLGNLGFNEVTFPNPVFHGDTLRTETEIVEARESKSRPEAGIVTARHRGYNQRDEVICECERIFMMKRRQPGA